MGSFILVQDTDTAAFLIMVWNTVHSLHLGPISLNATVFMFPCK